MPRNQAKKSHGSKAANSKNMVPSRPSQKPLPASGPATALHSTASLPFGESSLPGSWESLPSSALAHVMDLLPLSDLAAAACTCRAWRAEAAHDDRWGHFWQAEVGEQALWGWAKAGGGWREQLRARTAIREGDCSATVFPFSRLDGAVVEVLLRDGGGWQRIVTAQARPAAQGSVRLKGSTLKVWDAAGLCAARPLLVVHDVVKHIQLEDGRLLMWRIANDAIIRIRCLDPSDEAAAQEAATWAEHPDIVPSLLDVSTLTMRDVPLASRYGRGRLPLEWQDFFAGCVGCVVLDQAARSVTARLFNVDSGALVRESSCPVPLEEDEELREMEMSCILSRSGDPRAPLLVAAILFDCATFMWRLPPAPLTQWQHTGGDDSEQQQPAQQEQHQPEQQGAGGVQWGQLVHMYSTPDHEPVVDISVSTQGGRILVVGVECVTLLTLTGEPVMVVSMAAWRGVPVPTNEWGPLDVGAFSWPLPMSHGAAFYLDSCSSLFITDFRRPTAGEHLRLLGTRLASGDGRFPGFDNHMAASPQGGFANQNYIVQAHTDLRPSLPGATATLTAGRATYRGGSPQEPVIVEYPQDASAVFTIGDSSCPAVAKLLKLEKDRGTYLEGLGPTSGGPGGSRAASRRVVEGSGGGGSRAPLAPRAVVCIDSTTGLRYKTIPIAGVVEAVHSAGHYLVVAVAGREGYPEGPRGSLVVVDFTKEPGGFGGGKPQQPQASQRRQAWQQGEGGAAEGLAAQAAASALAAAGPPVGEQGQRDGEGVQGGEGAAGPSSQGRRRQGGKGGGSKGAKGSKAGGHAKRGKTDPAKDEEAAAGVANRTKRA